MPNWVKNEYIIEAERDVLDKIYELFKNEDEEPRIENGFGNKWLGLIVDKLGLDWNKIRCRGWYENVEFISNDTAIGITLYSAWAEASDFRYMLDDKFGVHTIYYAEDEFWNWASTNDVKGTWFQDRYLYDANGEQTWYETEDAFLSAFNEEFVTDFTSAKEAEEFINKCKLGPQHEYEDVFIGIVDVFDD